MRWLVRLWRWLISDGACHAQAARPSFSTRKTVPIARHAGPGRVPALHWKACHPLTVRRFKAEMACSHGHGLVLSGHRIAADGTVSPSVICKTRGCTFHDFVRLADWTGGPLD